LRCQVGRARPLTRLLGKNIKEIANNDKAYSLQSAIYILCNTKKSRNPDRRTQTRKIAKYRLLFQPQICAPSLTKPRLTPTPNPLPLPRTVIILRPPNIQARTRALLNPRDLPILFPLLLIRHPPALEKLIRRLLALAGRVGAPALGFQRRLESALAFLL